MDPSTSLGTEQCSHRISAAVSPACNGVWIVGSGVDVKHILRSLSCRRVLSRARVVHGDAGAITGPQFRWKCGA